MRNIFLLLVLLMAFSCKNDPSSEDSTKAPTEDLSINEKIAYAHGFDHFKDVEELQFTFNVSVEDSLRTKRRWNWKPNENQVRMTEGDLSFSYTRDDELAEEEKEIDQKFINDTYWLLFPFQLIWSDAEFEEEQNVTAPISKQEMDKLVVSYTGDGGYTPGDTYEIFYDEDLIVREWIYKSADGNRESPSTWEDYEDFNGLKIAKSHKSPDGSFELFFSDVEVR